MNNYAFVFTFGSILLASVGTALFIITMPHSATEFTFYIMGLAILFGIWAIDSRTWDTR